MIDKNYCMQNYVALWLNLVYLFLFQQKVSILFSPTTVTSEWRHSFTLLQKKYFDVFSVPVSLALFGRTQTHRACSALPNAHEIFRKSQSGSKKTSKY